jgi:hypothetical protein
VRISPLLLLALALGVANAAFGQAPRLDSSWAADPLLVFYPKRDCRGEWIELEVFDRKSEKWVSHPAHARVPVDSCQVEDAGRLFNEIRWRCDEPPGTEPPSVWIEGLDVFDPRVMEECAAGRREAETGIELRVEKPGRGENVRNPTMEVSVQGNVRMNGMDGGEYDVVLALDRSDATRSDGLDLFEAQIAAAEAFVADLRPRLGAVRVGIVSHPNMPPLPGDGGTGAHREIALTDDPQALAAALASLRARGPAGFPTFLSALEYGLAEVDPARERGARPAARKTLIVISSARRRFPFGPGADADASFRARFMAQAQRALDRGVSLQLVGLAGLAEQTPKSVEDGLKLCRGVFHRVPTPALGTPFLAAIPLPEIRQVSVENRTAKLAPRPAKLEPDGSFFLTLPAAPGPNLLRLRADLSDGTSAQRDWEFRFDDSWVRERLLAAEAERIRRIRQQKALRLDPQWQEKNQPPGPVDSGATP